MPLAGMHRMNNFASQAVVPGCRLLHTMLRVRNADASLRFYIDLMGMRLLRRRDFPEGCFPVFEAGVVPITGRMTVPMASACRLGVPLGLAIGRQVHDYFNQAPSLNGAG